MAKNPKDEQDQLPTIGSESITYIPKEGDPPKVRWGRITFHANVAVQVSDPKIIAKARDNKWFHVGAGAPKAEVEALDEPKNPDQYRAHVARWLANVESSSKLESQWAAEENLRIDCGVGGQDLELLGTLVKPKLAALKRAELPGA